MAATLCHEQIAASLGELHKRLKRVQNQMLKEYHVSLIEYHILIIIMRKDRVSQQELVEELDVDKALISRQTQAMQQKGLLFCCSDPDCRRKKILSLSEDARNLIPRLEEIHRQSLARLFSDLDERQLIDFQYVLEGLVSKICART